VGGVTGRGGIAAGRCGITGSNERRWACGCRGLTSGEVVAGTGGTSAGTAGGRIGAGASRRFCGAVTGAQLADSRASWDWLGDPAAACLSSFRCVSRQMYARGGLANAGSLLAVLSARVACQDS
jgi:hypothetical protein